MDRPNILWICTDQQRWTAPALDTNPNDSHPTFVGKVDTSIVSGAGGL